MAPEPTTNSHHAASKCTCSPSENLRVNLQVLSPSVGVNSPLLFPAIDATLTIKQLKERIRQVLPMHPSDESQRLIHRGRALVRDGESLIDVFGLESCRSPDQITIHLVLRDSHDATPPASARGPSPVLGAQPVNPRQPPHHAHVSAHPPPAFARRTMPPTSNPFPQPRMPSPSPIHTPEQAAAFQAQHQNMTQWLNHIQREAMARAINQNQRNRAHLGMRGIGDTAPNGPPQNGVDSSGRGSPAPSHTIYREHVGANGHTYQVETVIRTSAPATPNGAMSPADVQNIIRGADANQATLAMTNALRRSASNNSLHNRSFTQPGVTTSVFSNTAAMNGHARPPSDMANNSRPVSGISTTSSGSGSSQQGRGPDVYILSSPEGPRALLLNHSSLESYFTPRHRPSHGIFPHVRPPSAPSQMGPGVPAQDRPHHHHHHHHHYPRQVNQQQQPPAEARAEGAPWRAPEQLRRLGIRMTPDGDEAVRRRANRRAAQNDAQPQPQVDAEDQNQMQVQQQNQAPGMVHPGNPPAAAIPPLLMQLWPQGWLLFRLALFVWFFTSPNASWGRWLTIICVAVFIFVMSTGVLNGLGDLIRGALGRHMEHMVPALERPNQDQTAAQGQQNNGVERNREPRPAELAARLVAERRRRESWLLGQLRRVERAGLLFLASIAPGVAERHIANLEAQERAERMRREAEAAEAARLADLAAAEVEGGNENNEGTETNGDIPNEGSDGNEMEAQEEPRMDNNDNNIINNRDEEHPRPQPIYA